jgi:hypothetical protein
MKDKLNHIAIELTDEIIIKLFKDKLPYFIISLEYSSILINDEQSYTNFFNDFFISVYELDELELKKLKSYEDKIIKKIFLWYLPYCKIINIKIISDCLIN